MQKKKERCFYQYCDITALSGGVLAETETEDALCCCATTRHYNLAKKFMLQFGNWIMRYFSGQYVHLFVILLIKIHFCCFHNYGNRNICMHMTTRQLSKCRHHANLEVPNVFNVIYFVLSLYTWIWVWCQLHKKNSEALLPLLSQDSILYFHNIHTNLSNILKNVFTKETWYGFVSFKQNGLGWDIQINFVQKYFIVFFSSLLLKVSRTCTMGSLRSSNWECLFTHSSTLHSSASSPLLSTCTSLFSS